MKFLLIKFKSEINKLSKPVKVANGPSILRDLPIEDGNFQRQIALSYPQLTARLYRRSAASLEMDPL